MKLKGISKLEQHAEKLFLTLIAIAFLLVLSWQVLKGGSMLEVKNTPNVVIDQAFEMVVDEARSREGQVTDPQADNRAPTDMPNLIANFESKIGEVTAPAQPLQIALGRTGTDIDLEPTPDDPLIVELPSGFAPSTPVAHAFGGTIDPVETAVHPDLATFLPQEQPYDKFAVSVEASFDASELVQMLKADPDGDYGDAQPIPSLWWKKQLQILDVELWRQEVDAYGDPVGDPELLPPPPGRKTLRPELATLTDLPEVIAATKLADREKEHLTRPRFYHMIAGADWMPPSLTVENPGGQTEVERKKSEYQRYTEEIKRTEERLEALRDRQASIPILERTDVLAQGGRGVGGGGSRDRGRSERDAAESARERQNASENRLLSKIDELESRRDELRQELIDLGVDPEDLEKDDRIELVLNEAIGRLQDGGTFRLWTHDLGVIPGRTYRYQMRIVIPNPLFGYGANLSDDSRSLAESPVIYSDPSRWSDPVSVDYDTYIMMTKAGVRKDLRDGREVGYAAADLYHFFFGYWRKASAEIRPGDAIAGGIDLTELDLATYSVEVDDDQVGLITRQPMEGEYFFDVSDWFLLNVAPTQDGLGARGEANYVAILYGPDGELVPRRSIDDLRSETRSRLEESVEEGLVAVLGEPNPDAVMANIGEGDNVRSRRERKRESRDDDGKGQRQNPGGRGR